MLTTQHNTSSALNSPKSQSFGHKIVVTKEQTIIIHVSDDQNNKTREFKCNKATVLKWVFSNYLLLYIVFCLFCEDRTFQASYKCEACVALLYVVSHMVFLSYRNMRYFQQFLSKETIKSNNLEISVHCDMKVFDWLVRYIHKWAPKATLSVPIVSSIMISSHFLGIDVLVVQCVTFMYVQFLNWFLPLIFNIYAYLGGIRIFGVPYLMRNY